MKRLFFVLVHKKIMNLLTATFFGCTNTRIARPRLFVWAMGFILLLNMGMALPLFAQADEQERNSEQVKKSAETDDPAEARRFAPENAENTTQFKRESSADAAQRAVKAMVIPITEQINDAQLYILRRGLKTAIREDYDLVVLDMNTPGGALGTTLEMMKTLDNADIPVVTYVNTNAISAGSFIAIVTDYIYFHPKGIMGAAEAVSGSGEDINESMKRKIESVLDARVRALTQDADGRRYRAKVQRAMMKPDYQLKLDGEILSAKGELLTLTAPQALKTYGSPPQTLLAEGIADSVRSLVEHRHGEFQHIIKRMELTWSEGVAKWLNSVAPVLMGLGLLLLFTEFKTPGFGLFGIAGIILLGVVFAAQFVAGLAGYEPVIAFFLGIILIGVELFVLPGVLVAGVSGLALMVGSLMWALADIWPQEGVGDVEPGRFADPFWQLLIALGIAVGGFVLLMRFLPERVFMSQFLLNDKIGTPNPDHAASVHYASESRLPSIGAKGKCVTKMVPSGEVEIEGARYLARINEDMLEAGTPVKVVEHSAFQLIVEKDSDDD